MSTTADVSIIIIFLNTERFLDEAIASVVAQPYDSWELLLVDDGSTDGSTRIARRWAIEHPNRVRYLNHPGHQNLGMSASRNLGIAHASGEFLTFLDADDVWLRPPLAELVDMMRSHPRVAMVYGPIQWWYSWTGKPEDRDRDYVEGLGVPPNTVLEPPTLLTLFLQDKCAVPSGILVRSDVMQRVGGFEESFRGEYEDQVLCAKICLAAPVIATDVCWYRYRQHPDSTSAIGQITGEYFSARPRFLTWLEEFLIDNRVNDPDLTRALRRELFPYRHPRVHQIQRRYRIRSDQFHSAFMTIAHRLLPRAGNR